jgi:hypothetical protein
MAVKSFDPGPPRSIVAVEEGSDEGAAFPERLRAEGFVTGRGAISVPRPMTRKSASAFGVRSLRGKGGADPLGRRTASMDVSQ